MKTKMHINDFYLQSVVKYLRDLGRNEDADIFASIPGAKWKWGYFKEGSPATIGSEGNPAGTIDGNIKVSGATVSRVVTYLNGLTTTNSVTTLNTVALVPKEIRPKYIGNLTVSEANGKIDIQKMGVDMTKTGCYYLSVGNSESNASAAKFVVVIGSDEAFTDGEKIVSYLPFYIPPSYFNGGIRTVDAATYGYSATGSSTISNNRVAPVEIIVYQSTNPAVAPKETNPKLPNFKVNDYVPRVPSGYTDLGTLNVTIDWSKLNGRYKSKTHINQLLLDGLADALETAGESDKANKVKSMVAETFIPWQLTTNSTNKTTTLVGSRDSSSKVYISSVTFNHYNGVAAMRAIDFGFVYAPEANISFEILADLPAIKAKTDRALYAETKFGYFGKHVLTGSAFNRDVIESVLPFSIKGLNITVVPRDSITAATEQYINNQEVNQVFMGNNSYRVSLYPDQ